MFGHKPTEEPWVAELKKRLIEIKLSTRDDWGSRGSALYELFEWLMESASFSQAQKEQISPPPSLPEGPKILNKRERKMEWALWRKKRKEKSKE